MTKIIESFFKEGDTFIELGANEVCFPILAGKLCGSSGKIISMEPQKKLWNVINNNTFLNKLINIQILPYGIGSTKGEFLFQLYPTTISGASSFSKSLSFKRFFSWIRKIIYGTQIAKVLIMDEIRTSFPKFVKLIKIEPNCFVY